MSKPFKLPTLQDLSREELLLLVSIGWPEIGPAQLVRVQWLAAGQAIDTLQKAVDQNAADYQAALDRFKDCKPGSLAEKKARRAYDAARAIYAASLGRLERLAKRCNQLNVQYNTLSAMEG